MATTVLDAAVREFAESGLHAADLDRIAATAGTDVSTVLREFGSAEALFDRVLADSADALAHAVRLDAGDLPRFAGDLFDALQRDPTIARLAMWQALERPQAPDGEQRVVRAWLDLIRDAGGGAVDADTFQAAELLAYALALAKAETVAPAFLGADIAGAAARAERRAHVEEAMRRVVGHHV
jgi:AcrR family transcriptional regulator